MSELIDNNTQRKQQLGQLIRRLHDGASVEDVRADFERDFGSVSAAEIAEVEQALIRDGLPVAEVQRLCDVHSAVFRGSIEEIHRPADPTAVPGHPIHTMRRENAALESLIADHLRPHLEDYAVNNSQSALSALREDIAHLAGIGLHYSKKENLFFPFLEQYGITAPPKVMWGVDDEIRDAIREIRTSLESLEDRRPILREKVEAVLVKVGDMVFKEENILFPMMMETLTPRDWFVVAGGIGEIGYYLIDGAPAWNPGDIPQSPPEAAPAAEAETMPPVAPDARLALPSGSMSLEEIVRMLDTLPLDITFVDADDTVRYFSQGRDRIFARTLAVIGRKVVNCHPPASMHVVEKILEDLKSGRKDHEDFWIRMGGRIVYIRYFAVRSAEGAYLGTLEVTQDIAPIQGLEGEKRLVSD